MVSAGTRIYRSLRDWFFGLSLRERQLVAVASIILIFAVIYFQALSIYDSFAILNNDLARSKQDLSTISDLLTRYSKVKGQRDRIENEFRSVEFKEGELSYLEDLIRRKLGLSSGFTITPRAVTAFGENYNQNPFNIKFTVSDMKNILDFLSELVSGAQPLLLTRLDMRVTRGGDSIEVDLDVSSIHQKKGAAN